MKKIIIFNWKMAPESLKEAKLLLTNYLRPTTNDKKIKTIIAPPFLYLSTLLSVVGRRSLVNFCAQDVFYEDKGVYTGEISAEMLKNLGVEYALIGHSERRKYLNETDEMINKKVLAALKAGLKVVLCVGEPKRRGKRKEEREKWAKNYIKNQLQKDLNKLSSIYFPLSSIAIAYEPIWAISNSAGSHSDTPQDAVEMIKFIKQFLGIRYQVSGIKVLYGGSVSSKNIKDFMQHKEIDGVLVGGASLKIKEVEKIIKSVSDSFNEK